MSAEKKQNSSVKKESNKTTNQKNTNTNTKPKTTTKQEVKPKTSTTTKATTKPAAAKPVAKKPEAAKTKTTATTTKPKTTSKPVEHKTNSAKKPEPSKEVKKVEKTTKVENTKKESKNEETNRNSDNVIKTVVIVVIVLALIGLLVWVIIKATNAYKPKSYLDVALSSENYDEMISKFNKEMKKENETGYKDEYYYFNYAFNSHMFDDAASTVSQNPEENTTIPAQYKYIYGKTINNVIDEGKKLMEEKHFSLSDYVDYLNSLTKDPNLQNLSNATLNN